jgi:outer membrane protein W
MALAAALIAGLAATPAKAQEAGSLFLGVTAGGAYSGLRGDFLESSERARSYKWGFVGGATFEAYYKRNFAVKVDALYTQKGVQNVPSAIGAADLNLAYIDVPLMLNFNVHLSYDWSVAFYTGISIGFNVSCNLKSSDGSSVSCKDSEDDIGPKSTEFAWPFGLGVQYWPSGRAGNYLSLDVRYVYGFSSAFENSAADVKNQVLLLMVRYAFKIK